MKLHTEGPKILFATL